MDSRFTVTPPFPARISDPRVPSGEPPLTGPSVRSPGESRSKDRGSPGRRRTWLFSRPGSTRVPWGTSGVTRSDRVPPEGDGAPAGYSDLGVDRVSDETPKDGVGTEDTVVTPVPVSDPRPSLDPLVQTWGPRQDPQIFHWSPGTDTGEEGLCTAKLPRTRRGKEDPPPKAALTPRPDEVEVSSLGRQGIVTCPVR